MATAAETPASQPTTPAGKENVREIRLGLVCYGGVSLAIYMHGMTKELQKLVIASRALEDGTVLKEGTSEHVYQQVLQEIWAKSPDRVLPRVVIDVVAGTSAGGINGVILCKALAHNLSQDALRDLWFERGDIEQLLGGSFPKEALHLGQFFIDLFRNKARGPLGGQDMLTWLLKALDDMDKTHGYQPENAPPPLSLMPNGHSLQLFVTTTDYYGYRQHMTIADPPTVSERRNRQVLAFRYQPEEGVDRFSPSYNGALAFASRATSSFPGAFPPVQLSDLEKIPTAPRMPEEIRSQLFRAYELEGAEARETSFIDGGVLNNYPFKPAIDAIVKVRAGSEVSRYLLYLQPDPGDEVKNPTGEAPNFFGTIWAGLSSIASGQPILEELIAARRFNEQVQRIEELVKRTRVDIAQIFVELKSQLEIPLGGPLEDKTVNDFRQLRDRLDREAEERAGYLFDPYLQIRAHSIVDQFAAGICQVCDYPDEQSNIAFLIRLIIDCWARERHLIGDHAEPAARRELLRRFDLGYTRRRFAFVLQGVSELYHPKEGQPAPPRDKLDAAKRALYDGIEDLDKRIDASSEALDKGLVDALRAQFPLSLTGPIAQGEDLTKVAEAFCKKNLEEMNKIFNGLGERLLGEKDRIHSNLYRAFVDITKEWPEECRHEIMLRYLGFPFWDAMIYPATLLSEAGELRPLHIVRMSPADSTRLGLKTAKDKLEGVQFGHFGAFLKREWRENDYLWGRLDAAERLIGLLLKDAKDTGLDLTGSADWVKLALTTIVAEEKRSLGSIPEKIRDGLAKL
ncbi:MAG: patatin-like protein [Acidobacteriota bacterium]|nr:patatin-like protein [Acidobacteriota bacterium]